MIVAEAENALQFVTQPDHAALAGQFADHWGGEAVESLSPRAPVVHATYAHDDGWREYDRYPRVEDGEVVDFRSVPAETWTDLYEHGVDVVADADSYAGLLVSMHGAGLRRRRYGLSPSWPSTPPEFREYVDREERRQDRLADALHEEGEVSEADLDLLDALHETGTAPEGTDSRLWRNYRLLQAWDALSLSLCTSVPPGATTVENVPTAAGREDRLTVEPREGGFRVEPYPFDVAPLEVSVPARTADRDAADSEADLRRRYYETPRETETVTLLA